MIIGNPIITFSEKRPRRKLKHSHFSTTSIPESLILPLPWEDERPWERSCVLYCTHLCVEIQNKHSCSLSRSTKHNLEKLRVTVKQLVEQDEKLACTILKDKVMA